MKSVLLTTVVGAILGAIGLTWLYMALTSPESVREAGIGWGVTIFMLVAPVNAVIGAWFGLAVGLMRLALIKGNITRARTVGLSFGGLVVGFYLLLYTFTGVPGPSGMHHTSALTTEPTPQSQDTRDGVALCSPLFAALLLVGYNLFNFDTHSKRRRSKRTTLT